MIDPHSTAELVSLALTVPTILLAIGVVYLWGPAARRAWSNRPLTADGWFIVGVVVAFVGSIFDNLYWSIPWTASYIGHQGAPDLMSCGVYFNIFSRQLAGIVAACCHLRAAKLANVRGRKVVNVLIAGSYIGASTAALWLWSL